MVNFDTFWDNKAVNLRKKHSLYRETRQYISPKNISESLPDTSLVSSVNVNCNGTKIAIQLKKVCSI